MDELFSIAERMYDLLLDRGLEYDSWNETLSCLSCGAGGRKSRGLPQHKDNCQWKQTITDFERWKEASEQ